MADAVTCTRRSDHKSGPWEALQGFSTTSRGPKPEQGAIGAAPPHRHLGPRGQLRAGLRARAIAKGPVAPAGAHHATLLGQGAVRIKWSKKLQNLFLVHPGDQRSTQVLCQTTAESLGRTPLFVWGVQTDTRWLSGAMATPPPPTSAGEVELLESLSGSTSSCSGHAPSHHAAASSASVTPCAHRRR
jgi:hypothetical protein